MEFTALLTCKHVLPFEANGTLTATAKVGQTMPCPKCPAKKSGDQPDRTVKLVRFPEDMRPDDHVVESVQEAEAIADELRKGTVEMPADEAEAIATAVDQGVREFTTRQARLDAAREVKSNGGSDAEVQAVLATPLAAGSTESDPATSKRRGGRPAGRVTFLNLSPVRITAMVEALRRVEIEDDAEAAQAGVVLTAKLDIDRESKATVDLQAADVRVLLAGLGQLCDRQPEGVEPGTIKAGCRLLAWLEKFRESV